MKDREEIISLVQKLFNMSTDNGCTEEEAAAFAEKAQGLLFQYKLTMAEVEVNQGNGKGPAIVELDGDITSKKNWGSWKPSLANSVAIYNFCSGFYNLQFGTFTFIGQQTEAQVARELYNWLVIQVEAESVRACLRYRGHSRIPTYRRSFFTGVVAMLNSRLSKRWSELQGQTDQSSALVVHTQAQLKAYESQHHPEIKERGVRWANGSKDGYFAGVTAGKGMDIEAKKSLKGAGGLIGNG